MARMARSMTTIMISTSVNAAWRGVMALVSERAAPLAAAGAAGKPP
jgi:hypothetical protein